MSIGESLELALFYAAERLGPIRDEVVFVGGAVRGLLVTDTGAAGSAGRCWASSVAGACT